MHKLPFVTLALLASPINLLHCLIKSEMDNQVNTQNDILHHQLDLFCLFYVLFVIASFLKNWHFIM